jgi:ATP-dependent DNA ligase
VTSLAAGGNLLCRVRCPVDGGKDLRPLLLTRRKQLLTRLIPATTTVLSQVFSIAERGRDMFAAAERLDLEGIVAKRRWELFNKRV